MVLCTNSLDRFLFTRHNFAAIIFMEFKKGQMLPTEENSIIVCRTVEEAKTEANQNLNDEWEKDFTFQVILIPLGLQNRQTMKECKEYVKSNRIIMRHWHFNRNIYNNRHIISIPPLCCHSGKIICVFSLIFYCCRSVVPPGAHSICKGILFE